MPGTMKRLPKLLNFIIRFIQCHDIPGKYRLYEATKHKLHNRLITYNIENSEFSVPWDQWCFWLNCGPENYYLDEIIPFTNSLNQQLGSFDFFDLGADVGVVSALVNQYCPKLNAIYAFEPNPTSYKILQENIVNIDRKHKAYNLAVSDFNGQCEFTFNEQQGSDHEGHINKNASGITHVRTLDDIISENQEVLSKNLVFKIDVEGQEMATLKGAKQVIRSADKVVVLLELHPDVLKRDKQTAEDILEAAEDIRCFTWYVPLLGNIRIDRNKTFYSQFLINQYDIIGISS
jgi:FkbM family methyltransferase